MQTSLPTFLQPAPAASRGPTAASSPINPTNGSGSGFADALQQARERPHPAQAPHPLRPAESAAPKSDVSTAEGTHTVQANVVSATAHPLDNAQAPAEPNDGPLSAATRQPTAGRAAGRGKSNLDTNPSGAQAQAAPQTTDTSRRPESADADLAKTQALPIPVVTTLTPLRASAASETAPSLDTTLLAPQEGVDLQGQSEVDQQGPPSLDLPASATDPAIQITAETRPEIRTFVSPLPLNVQVPANPLPMPTTQSGRDGSRRAASETAAGPAFLRSDLVATAAPLRTAAAGIVRTGSVAAPARPTSTVGVAAGLRTGNADPGEPLDGLDPLDPASTLAATSGPAAVPATEAHRPTGQSSAEIGLIQATNGGLSRNPADEAATAENGTSRALESRTGTIRIQTFEPQATTAPRVPTRAVAEPTTSFATTLAGMAPNSESKGDEAVLAASGAALEAAADAAPTHVPSLSNGTQAPTDRSPIHAAADGRSAVAAQAEAHIAAPVHSPNFGPSLGLQISAMARDGTQEARLHLNPADMGPITVRISLDGVGARVDFVADVSVTRQAIEASLPALAGALRESGLTLTGGGVSQQQAGRQPGENASQGEPGGAGQLAAQSSGSDESPRGLRNLPLARGLVDLVA